MAVTHCFTICHLLLLVGVSSHFTDRYFVKEPTVSISELMGATSPPKSSNRDRILGVEGVNFEMNGTEPYLECASYNPNKCDPTKRSDCPTSEFCRLQGSHQYLSCVTVFKSDSVSLPQDNTTTRYFGVAQEDIVLQGCQERMYQEKEQECQDFECTSSREVPGTYRACCCKSKLCNVVGNVRVAVPAIAPPKKVVANKTVNRVESKEEKIEVQKRGWTTMDFVILFSIILLFVAAQVLGVICFMIHRRRMRRRTNRQNEFALQPMLTPSAVDVELQQRNVSPLIDENAKCSLPLTDFKQFARGRYGHVYCANNHSDDPDAPRRVAVKKHIWAEKMSCEAEALVYRNLLALPKWYPSVLRFVHAEQVGNEFWIVTEFHERLTLYEMIKRNTISLATATRIMLSMLDGLQFLHDDRPFYYPYSKPNIIHRDIKSKNVLIRSDLTAVIGDFGLARCVTGRIKKENDMYAQVGTRRYMAPEVLQGATEFTPAAFKAMDVYAMSLVIWEVLSRVQLEDETEADVPAYELPYMLEAGMNPSVTVMRDIVLKKTVRPPFREALSRFQRTRDIMSVICEMWETESNERITAGCAFERISRKLFEELERRPIDDPELKSVWDAYHAAPTTHPYPSPDPFTAFPPPPPIPVLGEYVDVEVDDARDSGRAVPRRREPVYDANLRRWLTEEEAELAGEYDDYRLRDRSPSPSVSEFECTDFSFHPIQSGEPEEKKEEAATIATTKEATPNSEDADDNNNDEESVAEVLTELLQADSPSTPSSSSSAREDEPSGSGSGSDDRNSEL